MVKRAYMPFLLLSSLLSLESPTKAAPRPNRGVCAGWQAGQAQSRGVAHFRAFLCNIEYPS
jgi:hypothetical protein